MCGITGIVDFNKDLVDKSLIKKMNSLISYRGPDGEGFFFDDFCALGHRRLSIIDLTQSAKQPMSNEEGNIWITFNGEIYNYIGLKKELEKKGHRFTSNSDTEVIIHGYEEYGENVVKKLTGMFAFGLWDSNKKKLLLGRDRAGQKPLFYHHDKENKSLIFASELKSILLEKNIPRTISKKSMSNYLTLGYIPAPDTIFENINKLQPGHILIFSDISTSLEIKQYWDLEFNIINKTESFFIEKIKKHLDESTKSQMMSDVPLGAFLSGGIDSSAVVAYMSKNSENPINTFSIGFEDKKFDETKYARIIAQKFKTNHTEFIVTPDAIKILPKLVWHYNEPYADSSAIPTYYLSEMTKKYVTVALNGDAGDENFAGYDRYAADNVINYYKKIPNIFKIPFESVVRLIPTPNTTKHPIRMMKRIIDIKKMNQFERYLKLNSYFDHDMKEKLLAENKEKIYQTGPIISRYFDIPENSLNKKLYVDFKTYLPDDLLVKVDIATMANSLEGRSPFLDHRFIEFNSTIPPNLKLKGFSKKYILKKALKGTIPKEILNRKKMGFGIPIGSWFKNELKSEAQELLYGKNTKKRKIFNYNYIERLFSQHLSGSENNTPLLWSLMWLEIWNRIYLDNDYAKKPNYDLNKII